MILLSHRSYLYMGYFTIIDGAFVYHIVYSIQMLFQLVS
jgi:hypothetical protein